MNYDPEKFDFGERTNEEIAAAALEVAEVMRNHFGPDCKPEHIVGMLAMIALQYQMNCGTGADSLHAIIHNAGVCWNAMLEHQGFMDPDESTPGFMNPDDDDDDDELGGFDRHGFSQN